MFGFRKVVGAKGYNSRGIVAARYHRSARTIKRWESDPRVDFPKPDIVINGNPYWSDETLDKFDDQARVAMLGPAAA